MTNIKDVVHRAWEPGDEPDQRSLFTRGRQRTTRRKLLGAGKGPRPCPSCGITRKPGEVKCPECGNTLLTFLARR